MAQIMVKVLVPILLVLVAGVVATPPGIAKNPSQASCQIKKYKHCYNLVHVCPKFCPDECTVECVSCKPICVGGGNPTPDFPPTPSTPENPTPEFPPIPSTPENPPPTPSSPDQNSPPSPPENSPPPPPPSSPSPPPPIPSTPENPPPPPSIPSPSPSIPSTPDQNSPPSPENPPPPPSIPSPSPSIPSTPENPPPSPSTPSPSPPTPSPPANPPPSPSPSTPSGSTGQSSSPKTAKCRNKNYPKCYNTEHVCPNACPRGCEVDCSICKPVCSCDRPGAVCQDPRFIGGDGITFYFHGKKDSNFCLVSDPNLHINAYFIGRRNENMKRDFTWVQSIAILFDNHQVFLGAEKTAIWEDSIDRLALTFDDESITLHESEGATWKSSSVPGVSIVRAATTNSVIVEVEGRLRITANVVPITEEDSRIHKYGITKQDCFAHLDLGFKFFSLSNEVSGVLGQTYKPNYVSRVNIGAKMPILGGGKEFETTSLFNPDCSVARFVGNNGSNNEVAMKGLDLPSLNCASGIDGQGVVCRR